LRIDVGGGQHIRFRCRIRRNAVDRALRDFNFEMDPQAFATILASNLPLALAPWEISSKVWLHAGRVCIEGLVSIRTAARD
jgi:inosine-uridine nucleoside N-ribohydrolase